MAIKLQFPLFLATILTNKFVILAILFLQFNDQSIAQLFVHEYVLCIRIMYVCTFVPFV